MWSVLLDSRIVNHHVVLGKFNNFMGIPVSSHVGSCLIYRVNCLIVDSVPTGSLVSVGGAFTFLRECMQVGQKMNLAWSVH